MPHNSRSPFASTPSNLHSASGFGKPTRPPIPEQGKQERDDAMDALRKSLESLNEVTLKRHL